MFQRSTPAPFALGIQGNLRMAVHPVGSSPTHHTPGGRLAFYLSVIPFYPCLVGGLKPSEKYEFVSWDDEIPNIWKNEIPWFQTTNQFWLVYINLIHIHPYPYLYPYPSISTFIHLFCLSIHISLLVTSYPHCPQCIGSNIPVRLCLRIGWYRQFERMKDF